MFYKRVLTFNNKNYDIVLDVGDVVVQDNDIFYEVKVYADKLLYDYSGDFDNPIINQNYSVLLMVNGDALYEVIAIYNINRSGLIPYRYLDLYHKVKDYEVVKCLLNE